MSSYILAQYRDIVIIVTCAVYTVSKTFNKVQNNVKIDEPPWGTAVSHFQNIRVYSTLIFFCQNKIIQYWRCLNISWWIFKNLIYFYIHIYRLFFKSIVLYTNIFIRERIVRHSYTTLVYTAISNIQYTRDKST